MCRAKSTVRLKRPPVTAHLAPPLCWLVPRCDWLHTPAALSSLGSMTGRRHCCRLRQQSVHLMHNLHAQHQGSLWEAHGSGWRPCLNRTCKGAESEVLLQCWSLSGRGLPVFELPSRH